MANGFFTRHSRGEADKQQSAPEPSAPVTPALRVDSRVSEALAAWSAQLDELTHMNEDGAPRLVIEQAHPGGLAQLYTDHPTKLSVLIRDVHALQRATDRAKTILARSRELASQHGASTMHISIGSARWTHDGLTRSSAALLRPVALDVSGNDVTITLLPGYVLDPQLKAALAAQGITPDLGALVAQAQTVHGFSSSALLAALRAQAEVLEHFELRDEIIIGIFEHPASQLQREYEVPTHITSSQIVCALAGDEDAAAQLGEQLPPVNLADRDPWSERGAGDLTPRQLDVIETVADGRSLIVELPEGADDRTLIGGLLADAAASGRTTLYIGGVPSRMTQAENSLRALGLGQASIRIDNTAASGEELRKSLREAMRGASSITTEGDDVEQMRAQLRDVRARLGAYTQALHKPYGAFGVTAFDALQVLTDLTSTHPGPATRVRLRESVLLNIAQDQGEKARELLHEAAERGMLTPGQGRAWQGIVISSPEQVPQILEVVHRLSHDLIPRLRVRMGALAGETGIKPATTVHEWKDQLELFEGLADVLDVFQPQIFEQPVSDMVIASASKQWRAAQGITMKRSERVRLVKRAKDFIRPGTHVEDLHAQLTKVQLWGEVWREHCVDDVWPTLPQRLDDAQELTRSIESDWEELAPIFATSQIDFHAMPVGTLGGFFDALDDDPEGARALPHRIGVLKGLGELGLSDLAKDLRDRAVATELIDAELDLAWWASVLGLMLAHEPGLGGFDPAHLEDALAAGRHLDAQQVASLAPQALRQLQRLRLQAIATRRDQVDALDTLLEKPLSAKELYTTLPLVRQLVPIVFTAATLVPSLLRPGHKVDLLVLDDVDDLPLAELVPIIARARQVLVVARESRGDAQGTNAAFAKVLPTRTMDAAPAMLNDQVAMLLAGYGLEHIGLPVPYTSAGAAVEARWCDGTGMPAPDVSAVESTTAEVEAVTKLVLAHALGQPERSLAVIALNTRHADRIRQELHRLSTKEPGLASFTDTTRPEPFGVFDLHSAAGISRDRIIISVGYAKTPHGRVIHDFGQISGEGGDELMAQVLRTVRGELTLVSSLRAAEIDRSRLSADGANMLVDLLELGEGHVDAAEHSWPVLEAAPDSLLIDLADRLYRMGLDVVANLGVPGGMRIPLAIGHPEVPGRLLLAVLTDDDAYVAEPSLRVRDRVWPAMLEAQGWKVHTALSMAVFIDPAKEAETIVQLVLDAVDDINGPADVTGIEDPQVEVAESLDAADLNAAQVDSAELAAAELAGAEPDSAGTETSAALAEGVGDGLADAGADSTSEAEAVAPTVPTTLAALDDAGLDDIIASTSDARERADEFDTGMLEMIAAAAAQASDGTRPPRPAIAQGLPLAAYSDDQLDEMAMWVRSDGVERSFEETVEELRLALGITRRGFQSDAVLGNVVRRTARAAGLDE